MKRLAVREQRSEFSFHVYGDAVRRRPLLALPVAAVLLLAGCSPAGPVAANIGFADSNTFLLRIAALTILTALAIPVGVLTIVVVA